MTDNMNMDLDQEMFDEFSLGDEDILKLEQEEQLYLSQQPLNSQQMPSSQAMQTSQSTQQSQSVNRNRPVEEINTRSLPTATNVLYADPVEPAEHTTSTGYGPEADRVIESLRFQLQRLEVSSTSYNEQNSSKQLLDLKEMIKEKELQVIQLKKDLYKYREKELDQGKRTFPGINVYDKPKPKKSSRPSPFSQISSTFSSAKSRSSTPSLSSQQSQRSHIQSQLPSQPQSEPRAKQPRLEPETPTAPLFVKQSNVPNLAQLASQQPSLPPPPSGIIPNRQPKAKVKSEPTSQHINLEPNKRPPPKKSKFEKGPKSKLTATESNNKLLRVLFYPAFLVWNLKDNKNVKDINMILTRQRIKEFSDTFSKQFKPEREQCSSTQVYNNLTLLATDIYSYLVKSERADATIRLLLNALNLCLSVCIKEKIYNIIQNIASVINLLSAHFSVATRYLYKDLTFDKNSLLTQFAKALVLYPLTDPEPLQLLLEKPDIENKAFGEITRDALIYNTTPTKISQAIHTVKTPKEAVATVTCILELFYRIGCYKPSLDFLMYDDNFLNLLHHDRPFKIIISAINVLEANIEDLSYLSSYDDDECRVIFCLSNLLTCSQDALSIHDWYKLRFKCMRLLHHISQAKLPSLKMIDIQKEIFFRTNEMLDKESISLNKIQTTSTTEIRKESGILLEIGMKTMYQIMNQCPEDIFQHVHPLRADNFLKLVVYFQEGILRSHPANNILALLQSFLFSYLVDHPPSL